MATIRKRGIKWQCIVRRNDRTASKSYGKRSDAVRWGNTVEADRPMMERLMRDGALNGWSGDAQRLFDEISNRPEWAHEQAAAGLAQLVQLGLIALPESDVPVVHPAHFGQMPAGMVSSAAQTMDTNAERSTLLNDDGTIEGTKIENAPEPGTTQGSKRKKPRSLSKNQRL